MTRGHVGGTWGRGKDDMRCKNEVMHMGEIYEP